MSEEFNTFGVESLADEKQQLRKWRVYVDYATDIPDWADRQEGPRGGVYYEVADQSLINELLSPPYHEVDNPQDYAEIQEDEDGYRQTELPDFGDDGSRQTTIDEYSMERGAHLIRRTDEKEQEYWRVYVDDEEEAPDWATVSGPSPEGNLYYIVFDEDLFADLIEEPQHEVSDYDLDEYLSNYEGESVDLEKDDLIIKRRFQVYVESESQVPDWARSYVGDQGGIFYVVYNKRLFSELMSSPKHEIPDDFNLQTYMYGGPGPTDEEEDDQEEKSLQFVDLEKRRIYIDSPQQAPDGKEVQQGDKGGYYYIAESDSDEDEDSDEPRGSEFEQKLRSAFEEDEGLVEINCSEFAGNIDKIQDKQLLERVYKEETREAIRREIEDWAGQMNKYFEFNYKTSGPSKTKSFDQYPQVFSLTDAEVDEEELEGADKKAVEKWKELRDKREEVDKIEADTRREFRKEAENVESDEVLQYLWEKGLGEFEDLNTHISDILRRRGYSPRTEMVPGIMRRLDLKYDYSLHSTEGEVADSIETGDILRRTKQDMIAQKLSEIDNADLLNDIKFAALERGVKEDSEIIRRINTRVSELDCKAVESFNIRYGLYRDIISRPGGLAGRGQGVDKLAWDDVWENVSSDDLKEFTRAAKDRNNEAHSSIVEGLLCYRNDVDISTRDMVDLDYRNGTMDQEEMYSELERILSRIDPIIGACILTRLGTMRSELLDTNKEGYVLFRGMMGIDGSTSGDSNQVRFLLAHLIGHILHDIMGLDVKDSDEANDEQDDLGDGWEYTVMQPTDKENDYIQEFFEKMRKEWKRYTSQDAEECRIYQRVTPSEFMACTFALWITDKHKLNIIHPEMESLYDDKFGGEDQWQEL